MSTANSADYFSRRFNYVNNGGQGNAYGNNNYGGYGGQNNSRGYNNGGNGGNYNRQGYDNQRYNNGGYRNNNGFQQRPHSPLFSFVKELAYDDQRIDDLKQQFGEQPISVVDVDQYIATKTPYNADLVQVCKQLGGVFFKPLYCWFFGAEKRQDITNAIAQFFGDGSHPNYRQNNYRRSYNREQGLSYRQERPSYAQQSRMPEQAKVCLPPTLSLGLLQQVSSKFTPEMQVANFTAGSVTFCRVPQQSSFSGIAMRCGGVWIEDLQVWALSTQYGAIFSPAFEELKQSMTTAQQVATATPSPETVEQPIPQATPAAAGQMPEDIPF